MTGCAGFIGSHLTEQLLADGWSVVGVDSIAPTYDTLRRRSQTARLTEDRHFEFIEGDLNRVDLSEIVGDSDVVFHLAARPGVRASWRDFSQASDANILATQRVLEAVAESGDTRLVFASSSSVYGQADEFPVNESQQLAPISPYGVTKASCEALLSAYASQFDVDVTSLRYFTVYGPRQRSDMAFTRWIGRALRGEPLPVYGDGKAIRDFTFVSDVVNATILAAEETSPGHRVYNVAGGSPASLSEVLDLIEVLLDAPIDVVYTEPSRGDPKRTGGDTSLIRNELGWSATVDLRTGLEAQVSWMRGSIDSSASS